VINDAQHGYGKYKYVTGKTYTGMWQEDTPHGKGVSNYLLDQSYMEFRGSLAATVWAVNMRGSQEHVDGPLICGARRSMSMGR
jgi:hypothetical protein